MKIRHILFLWIESFNCICLQLGIQGLTWTVGHNCLFEIVVTFIAVYVGPVRAIEVQYSITEIEEFPPKDESTFQEGRRYDHPGIVTIMLPSKNVAIPLDVQLQIGAMHGQTAVGLVDAGDRLIGLVREGGCLAQHHWGQTSYESLSSLFKGWVHIWLMSVAKPTMVRDIGKTGCKGNIV